MDVDAVAALVSTQGWALLQSLPRYDETQALALGERLRAAGYPAALVAAALTQSRLRARAGDKFGAFADGMLFTSDGLEQATRLEVAAQHVFRYLQVPELRGVLDLCCGIGGDAMSFAGSGLEVHGVDADAVTAAVAGVNLRHWPGARVTVGQARDARLPTGPQARHTGVFLDPSRRTPGHRDARGRATRLFRLDQLSPAWGEVCAVAAQVPATGAKLTASFPHDAVPVGAEAQWVSWRGDVVECGVWWGPLARTRGRSASVLNPDRPPVVVTQDEAPADVPAASTLGDLGRFVYEPDKAVLRAGLTGVLVAAVDGLELAPQLGYVTSDVAAAVPYARRLTVVDAMPFNVKALRAWLRVRQVGTVTVKQRGVGVDADALRRELRLAGDAAATLIVTRVGRGQAVLVVGQPGAA